jgi:hypothetical protein
LTRQSYALTILGTDLGVDPQAIEDMQVTLLRHHKITSSQYSVNHSVKSTRDLLATMSGMDYVLTYHLTGCVCALVKQARSRKSASPEGHVLPAGRLAEKLWREQNERWPSKAKRHLIVDEPKGNYSP